MSDSNDFERLFSLQKAAFLGFSDTVLGFCHALFFLTDMAFLSLVSFFLGAIPFHDCLERFFPGAIRKNLTVVCPMRAILNQYRKILPFGRSVLRSNRRILPFGRMIPAFCRMILPFCRSVLMRNRMILPFSRMVPAFFRPSRGNTNQPFASHLFKVFFKRCCNGSGDDARTDKAAAEQCKNNRHCIVHDVQR